MSANKALQGTSGQRGFPKIVLLPKYAVNQNLVVQSPLAPELKYYILQHYEQLISNKA